MADYGIDLEPSWSYGFGHNPPGIDLENPVEGDYGFDYDGNIWVFTGGNWVKNP